MPHITVHGISFSIPCEYRAGHVLSEWEASTLQRVFMRNLSKSLFKVTSTVREDERESVGRAHVSEFVEGFQGGHDRMRAIRSEARRIALGAIEQRQYRRGQALRDLGALELEDMVSQLANSESIKREAMQRVDSVQRIAQSVSFFGEEDSENE
jgi:hypothetical protein